MVKNDSYPIFIDIEASSLGSKSYPIEIACTDSSGHIHNYLISPDSITSWTDWNIRSEQLHGISRKRLIDEGLHPSQVCEYLTYMLDGKRCYSDAPDYDKHWLIVLFEATRLKMLNIELLHTDDLFIGTLKEISGTQNVKRLLDEIKLQVRAEHQERHRAVIDVSYLKKIYDKITSPVI